MSPLSGTCLVQEAFCTSCSLQSSSYTTVSPHHYVCNSERAAQILIYVPLCCPALDSLTMKFLVQRLFTPVLGAFRQNWLKWKQALFCILTSVHAYLKTAYCYCQQCCVCACWIPPAQTPTSPPAFPNVLKTQVCACVYFCSCGQCSSPKHSHLLLQTSDTAWCPSTVLQPLSSSSAIRQTGKLARNSRFTLRIV